MRLARRLLLLLLLGLFALLSGGCTTTDPDHTSIPWSRPATWEGQLPGMGS